MKGNHTGREIGNSREVYSGIRESKREMLQLPTGSKRVKDLPLKRSLSLEIIPEHLQTHLFCVGFLLQTCTYSFCIKLCRVYPRLSSLYFINILLQVPVDHFCETNADIEMNVSHCTKLLTSGECLKINLFNHSITFCVGYLLHV